MQKAVRTNSVLRPASARMPRQAVAILPASGRPFRPMHCVLDFHRGGINPHRIQSRSTGDAVCVSKSLGVVEHGNDDGDGVTHQFAAPGIDGVATAHYGPRGTACPAGDPPVADFLFGMGLSAEQRNLPRAVMPSVSFDRSFP